MKSFFRKAGLFIGCMIGLASLANFFYYTIGIEFNVENTNGQSATFLQKGVYVPGIFEMKVVKNEDLGFMVTDIGGIFSDYNLNGADAFGPIFLKETALKKMKLFYVSFVNTPLDDGGTKKAMILNFTLKEKREDSFLSTDTVNFMENILRTEDILVTSEDSQFAMHYVKFDEPKSGAFLWRELLSAYDGKPLSDLLSQAATKSGEPGAIDQGTGRYWGVTTTEASEGFDTYTVALIELTEDQFKEKKMEQQEVQ